MAPTGSSEATSPFDEMLRRNWERFDALSGRPAKIADPQAAGLTTTEVISSASATARDLDGRFGASGWRYQITDHHRDGDEVTVLCKLVVDPLQSEKMQFGSARIGHGGTTGTLAGSSDGVSFAADASPMRAHDHRGESDAYRQATEAALAKCAALL